MLVVFLFFIPFFGASRVSYGHTSPISRKDNVFYPKKVHFGVLIFYIATAWQYCSYFSTTLLV